MNAGDGNNYVLLYNQVQNSSVKTGGAGNDSIVGNRSGYGVLYPPGKNDGKDTITGFNENDTLQLADSTWTPSTSGSDVLVKIGSSSVLLKNAKGKKLNIFPAREESLNIYNRTSNKLICGSAYNDTLRNEGVAVTLVAGEGADYVYLFGAAEKSMAIGGAGNDTLTVGAGSDLFFFDKGSAFITDYAAGQDKIKISGKNKKNHRD